MLGQRAASVAALQQACNVARCSPHEGNTSGRDNNFRRKGDVSPAQGVAKSFREIFRDLAPGGHGELVMQKRVRRADPGPDGDELGNGSGGEERDGDAGGAGISEKYAGVKVKVRFAVRCLLLSIGCCSSPESQTNRSSWTFRGFGTDACG